MIHSGNSNTTFWFGLGLNSLCYCKSLCHYKFLYSFLYCIYQTLYFFVHVSVEAVESAAAKSHIKLFRLCINMKIEQIDQ